MPSTNQRLVIAGAQDPSQPAAASRCRGQFQARAVCANVSAQAVHPLIADMLFACGHMPSGSSCRVVQPMPGSVQKLEGGGCKRGARTRGVKQRGVAEALLHQAQRGHAVVVPREGGPREGDEVHLCEGIHKHFQAMTMDLFVMCLRTSHDILCSTQAIVALQRGGVTYCRI